MCNTLAKDLIDLRLGDFCEPRKPSSRPSIFYFIQQKDKGDTLWMMKNRLLTDAFPQHSIFQIIENYASLDNML
jgi:hypothetical protein